MKKIFLQILICLIAGLLNYGICWIAQSFLVLPLYLDTIMIMAVLFALGFWPAIGTLCIHYLITIIQDFVTWKQNSYMFLYIIPGIAIVLVTWLFTRNKQKLQGNVNFVFLYILLACSCATAASCITGGIVNFFRISQAGIQDSWTGHNLVSSIQGTGLKMLGALIVGRIPITFLDRFLTTYAGFGIYILYTKFSKKGIIYEE